MAGRMAVWRWDGNMTSLSRTWLVGVRMQWLFWERECEWEGSHGLSYCFTFVKMAPEGSCCGKRLSES